MVVAQVVRLRNTTLRTFYVEAGDPFYTPVIDGKPWDGGPIEVPPGFDQPVDGLVVPWSSMTTEGMVITEAGSDAKVRCVVGPKDEDTANMDWLQIYDMQWEPLEQSRWVLIGKRHILGTIGGSSDWQITFRDARGKKGETAEGNESDGLEKIMHFDRAVVVAPQNTVFLNVFDLASAVSVTNAILCNTIFNTIGAFHAAVEVYGEEWSFYRTPAPTACGVHRSAHARHHPVHIYRQSINLGKTTLKDWEVRYLIRAKLSQKWPGGSYDLLHRNCIHFCDELLLSLGVKPVPAWVRGLHETGASVLRIPWPLSYFLSDEAPPEEPALALPGDSSPAASPTAAASATGVEEPSKNVSSAEKAASQAATENAYQASHAGDLPPSDN